MLLRTFISNTLKELDDMDGGVVEFDIGIQAHHADFGANAGSIIENSASKNRIRFSVKLAPKPVKDEV